jgi:hypothetical protein
MNRRYTGPQGRYQRALMQLARIGPTTAHPMPVDRPSRDALQRLAEKGLVQIEADGFRLAPSKR